MVCLIVFGMVKHKCEENAEVDDVVVLPGMGEGRRIF